MSFEDAHRFALGIVPVPLNLIEFHPFQRHENASHVETLCNAFSNNMLLRWAHPIEVILSHPVTDEWTDSLRKTGQLPPLEPQNRLLCIGGKHRTLAARRYLQDAEETLDQSMESWPAMIYTCEMGQSSWLRVFIMERNTVRYTLPTRDSELLLGLDRMVKSSPDLDVYSILAKHSREASSLRSLHDGRGWAGIRHIFQDSFFTDLKRDVYMRWPVKWRMYPVSSKRKRKDFPASHLCSFSPSSCSIVYNNILN